MEEMGCVNYHIGIMSIGVEAHFETEVHAAANDLSY
jgi:hypothetical protein